MQSQCAPLHLKSTTVFLLKSWKMTFCSQFGVFFPGLYDVFLIFFSCSDAIFSILWPKKVFCVVFLIYFTCRFHWFCCDTVVKQQKKKPEELYTAKLTHKPTEGKEHSLRRCLNWKTISHTALPLITSFSDISHFKMVSLTVLASRFFWFRWSICHTEKNRLY